MYHVCHQKNYTEIDENGLFINDKMQANYQFNHNYYEYALIQWCKENFIKEDRVFIDIGSHIGLWSCHLADKAMHTYAFECNREVYYCFCANIYLKKLSSKITSYPVGLSNSNSSKEYYIRSSDGGGNGVTKLYENESCEKRMVDVCTLDHYRIENIGLIKIDVEGHEKEVLEGAIQTLQQNGYPPIVFESWEDRVGRTALRDELFLFVESIGYKIVPIANYKEMFLAVKN